MTHGVRTIGIAGAGTMGCGIAELAARRGFVVRLHDAAEGAAERAAGAIRETLARDVAKGRLRPAEAEAIGGRIMSAGLKGIARSDLVIEAVREDLEAKRSVFRALSGLSPATLLATNTSSLSVTAISGAVANPSRFAGMHFFNPPVRMPVVEIVRVATTGDTTVRALAGVAAALGQRAFVVADTPGFLVNHIGRA